MFERRVMGSMYGRAQKASDLPWYSSEVPPLLQQAMERHPRGARALDLGCGAGIYAVELARRGFRVTGIDLIPRAIELAAAHARGAGVDVELLTADLDTWDTTETFDLILDSGCLHSLIGSSRRRYAERVCRWLAPEGDYVLGHWGKRHPLDWRPFGPRRATRADLLSLFAPALVERAHHETLLSDVPAPFGPTVMGIGLWLQRARG